MTKRHVTTALLILIALTPAVHAQTDLAALMPDGAIAYLEADNLLELVEQLETSGLINQFQNSEAQALFSRSKLYLKLGDRIRSLEENTGFALRLDRLKTFIGAESALALYDIGDLRMTLITRVGAAKVQQSALWPLRESFDTRRSAGGQEYYVKEDPYGRASLAFAFIDDVLILSTDIPRFEASVALLADGGESLSDNSLFREARAQWQSDSQVRLFLDQQAINATPHFRSYWVWGNQQDFDDYRFSAVSLSIADDAMTEYRSYGREGGFETASQEWLNQVDYITPVLLSVEAVDLNALKAWAAKAAIGLTPDQQQRLATLIVDAGVTSMATVVERGGQGGAGLSYLLHLESPADFDVPQFEELLATGVRQELLPDFARLPGFINASGMLSIDLPLAEERMPAYALKGSELVYQPRRYLPASAITRFEAVPENAGQYSFLDLGTFSTLYSAVISDVAGLQMWKYGAAKEVAGESVPALLELAASVLYLEKMSWYEGDIMKERIIYHLQ